MRLTPHMHVVDMHLHADTMQGAADTIPQQVTAMQLHCQAPLAKQPRTTLCSACQAFAQHLSLTA